MKTRMKNQCLAACLCMILVLFSVLFLPVQYSTKAAEQTVLPQDAQDVEKHETVYVRMDNTGEIESISVCNYFSMEAGKTYRDYGRYEQIKNLTDTTEPMVSGDTIYWTAEKTQNFCYEGVLQEGEIPWDIQLSYTLDGKKIQPEALLHKSGKVEISLSASPNPKADSKLLQGYTLQIQMPLDLEKASNIQTKGATAVVTGSTYTIAYNVLPKNTVRYTVSFDAKDFSMASLNCSIMQADMTGGMDTASMTSGVEELKGGASQLTDGTKQLKNGLRDLSGGIGALNKNTKDFSSGASALDSGIQQYDAGLSQLNASLSALKGQGSPVAEGLQQLADGIRASKPNTAPLQALVAQYGPMAQGQLPPGVDPASQEGQMLIQQAGIIVSLAQGNIDQADGLETLAQSIEGAKGGVLQYSGYVDAAIDGFQLLYKGDPNDPSNPGFAGIVRGSGELSGGASKLSSGINALDHQTQALPGAADQLAEGQQQLSNGISLAIDKLMGLFSGGSQKPLSFAAPGKITPLTLQFVVTTEGFQ